MVIIHAVAKCKSIAGVDPALPFTIKIMELAIIIENHFEPPLSHLKKNDFLP